MGNMEMEKTSTLIKHDINWYIENGLVHEIHTSERKSFRGCRRRWDWVYRGHYYPRVTHKNLEFGTAYHTAMEIFYRPETWGMPQEIKVSRAVQEFINDCERQRKDALKLQGDNKLPAEIEIDYNERIELGKGMIEYYLNKVAPVIDNNWKPVKVEVEFTVPIPNPETGEELMWCRCLECETLYVNSKVRVSPKEWETWAGLPVVFSGRIDMLAEDEYGNYWVFDWKTAAAIYEDKDWLDLDDQISSYVWALNKLGIPVKGFVYHEQFKGYPQPPTENMRLSGGRRFSVNKQQSVDYATFLQHVSRFDTAAWSDGKYDDMLTFLRAEGRTFYDRRVVHKTLEDNKSTEFNIGLEALDMIDPTLRIYPNGGRFSCNNCAFKTPCIEKNSGGDYVYALETMFEQKEHYYKELRASTESK